MEIVLIHFYIRADKVDDFMAFRRPVPRDVEGFFGEVFYQRFGEGEPGTVEFVNIARWDSRARFEQRFGTTPEPQPFEIKPRWREWLKPADAP